MKQYVSVALGMVLFFLFSQQVFAENNEERHIAGKIIQIEGEVTFIRNKSQTRETAVAGVDLFDGDAVQTGADGWAALMMSDESIVQLNKNSVLILKQVAQKAGWLKWINNTSESLPDISEYILKKGKFWLRNKNTDQYIDIHTPYVSTSIRGTELDIDIRKDRSTLISILEGRVFIKNDIDETTAEEGEQVFVKPGFPFEKKVLLNPENAVQWTISFSPVMDIFPEFITESGQDQNGLQALFSGQLNNAKKQFQKDNSAESLTGRSMVSIISRDYQSALEILSQAKEQWSDHLPASVLKTLIHLILNQPEQALISSNHSLSLETSQPAIHVIDAWVKQAQFDLAGAMHSTLKALSLDKDYIPALLNLARLQFAAQDLDGSLASVEQVMRIKDNHPDAYNLKGFLMLAMLKTRPAVSAFEKAVALNPSMGEPHLGLCLAKMRQGDGQRAQKEIAKAILLEPQRSVFLSYWAKMLYEKKRFKQALDMLAKAQRLDPNDPTPWLYRSHVLRDLNRIHDAIYSLQKAVALNNNQAVFKSRFFLDRDLAVQNVNLAQLYRKLGVSEWASVMAMRSIKKDNNNFAAHDFVASQLNYLHGSSSLGARSSRTKAFLMKPANANTLSGFNNYTLFFEQPEIETTLSGFWGNNGRWDGKASITGALPEYNTAFSVTAYKNQDNGLQVHDWQDSYRIEAAVKWDATWKDTFSLQTEMYSLENGDLSKVTNSDQSPNPNNKADNSFKHIRAGYVRTFAPESKFFLLFEREYNHYQYARTQLNGSGSVTLIPYTFDYLYDYNKYETLDDPFTNIQALQTFKYRDHSLSAGVFWYESDRDYRINEVTNTDYYWAGTNIFAFDQLSSTTANHVHPRKMRSVFAQDIWNPADNISIEAAIYLDKILNVNSQDKLTWEKTYLNPRFGVIFEPTENDTIAFSVKRFLETYDSVSRIDPIEVAGHILPSFFEGSLTEEIALSWQHDWPKGFFWAKTYINEPTYKYLDVENGETVQKELDQKYVALEMAINHLLFDDVGLAAGYTFFSIERDRVTPLLEGENQWYWARITKLHHTGLAASIGASYYETDFDAISEDDRGFFVVSSYLEYELPKKAGKLRFEIQNILDRQFNGVPLSNMGGIKPDRTFGVRIEFNF